MINDVLKNITIISENEDDNTNNFIDSLNYLDNLYKVCQYIVGCVPLDDIEFLPSFISKELSEKLGILCTEKEKELKIFKIKSSLFLGDDKLVKKLETKLSDISESTNYNSEILNIILK